MEGTAVSEAVNRKNVNVRSPEKEEHQKRADGRPGAKVFKPIERNYASNRWSTSKHNPQKCIVQINRKYLVISKNAKS